MRSFPFATCSFRLENTYPDPALDKCWINEDAVINYNSELTGTDRSTNLYAVFLFEIDALVESHSIATTSVFHTNSQ